MEKYASKVVSQALAWLGFNEYDGSHKQIIDVYNSHKPLARGYAVKYTDAWCATFVSAVAVKLGYTDIIPTECSCPRMITLFQNIGCWIENENRTPNPGEIIFYDWEDNGIGDNRGSSDHVGIVEKVSGGVITVIEGNYSNSVKRRTLAVNGKYIRGYGVPKYDAEATTEPASNASTAEKLTVDGQWGKLTTTATQKVLGTPVDGIVSNQARFYKKYVPAALTSSWEFKDSGYSVGSALIRAIQTLVGATADGLCGNRTVTAMQNFLKKNGYYNYEVDGYMGEKTVRGWQQYINSRL